MNKVKYYGYKFGKVCTYIGVMIMMLMVPCMANDNAISIWNVFNWWAVITFIIGFGMYNYGVWRCGYETY